MSAARTTTGENNWHPRNAAQRLAMYDDAELNRFATFKTVTAGASAWQIAKALNRLHIGVDYRGCSLLELADEFARRSLREKTREQLASALKAAKGEA